MSIDLSVLRSFLPVLYHDRMRIWRSISTVKANGAIDNRLPNINTDTPLFEDIPCRFYSKTPDAAQGGQALAPVNAGFKVMCDTLTDIRAGDLIVIDRYTLNGSNYYATYNGRAGEPTVHAGHMEFILRVEEFA